MSNRRNYGLDVYRILCCFGVLTYHVMDDILGKTGASILYFMASYCVPGFFLLSGFLQGIRPTMTLDYVEGKIIGTMKKLFAWIILWSMLHFVNTGEIYDLWQQLTAGLVSGGILPVSWFLFTYCFLLFLVYPLWHLKNKYKKYFNIMAIIWIILLAADVGRELIFIRTQSLWLHLYIGYFAFGMALTDIFAWIKKAQIRKICIVIALNFLVITSAIYIYEITHEEIYMAPHQYYGRWFYSLWLMSLFCLCILIDIKNTAIQKVIKRIAGNTMVVYLGHLPILIYITGIYPLQNTGEAIGCIIFLFVLLFTCAECMKKLPLLRKMV